MCIILQDMIAASQLIHIAQGYLKFNYTRQGQRGNMSTMEWLKKINILRNVLITK